MCVGELDHDIERAVAEQSGRRRRCCAGRSGCPGAVSLCLARRRARALEGDRPRHGRRHQLEERQEMGAAERSTESAGEAPSEALVQMIAGDAIQARHGIAAAFAAGRLRRLDRDEGLVDLDPIHPQCRRIEVELDVHHVDDAGRLDIVDRRDTAVLAQVDHVAARAPEAGGFPRDDYAERAGVERECLRSGFGGFGEDIRHRRISCAGRSCVAGGRAGCGSSPSWSPS